MNESFDYSFTFGDLEGISINKNELMFRYTDSESAEKDLESFLRLASKTLNLDDLVISGEQTILGIYKLSISETVVKPMSAREWIEIKFGSDVSHGVAQMQMMDDYAEYFHSIKVGNH
jgi:hypothetical protein